MRVNGEINVTFLREKMPPEVTLDSFSCNITIRICSLGPNQGSPLTNEWQFVSI